MSVLTEHVVCSRCVLTFLFCFWCMLGCRHHLLCFGPRESASLDNRVHSVRGCLRCSPMVFAAQTAVNELSTSVCDTAVRFRNG